MKKKSVFSYSVKSNNKTIKEKMLDDKIQKISGEAIPTELKLGATGAIIIIRITIFLLNFFDKATWRRSSFLSVARHSTGTGPIGPHLILDRFFHVSYFIHSPGSTCSLKTNLTICTA